MGSNFTHVSVGTLAFIGIWGVRYFSSECMSLKEEKVSLSTEIRETIQVDGEEFVALLTLIKLAWTHEVIFLTDNIIKARIDSNICQMGGQGATL